MTRSSAPLEINPDVNGLARGLLYRDGEIPRGWQDVVNYLRLRAGTCLSEADRMALGMSADEATAAYNKCAAK
jgi:hypothetical protein